MARTYDAFVVFAEMRTGSNLLEANLNLFDGISCLGEAFNPHFIGYPNKTELLGLDQATRDADPQALLDRVRGAEGLAGFRYFHDHDPRILEPLLDDARIAKIVLTRNPVESYVSWKIAQQTDQWKLTNVARRKDARAVFDSADFEAHLEALQGFQVRLLNGLQKRGQTAFYVAYEDVQDLGVMNGLARWLGCETELEGFDHNLKRQNPAPISDKVENFDEMQQALARLDRFDLSRTPNFEPRRGAAVPGYVAAGAAPLLYMPIKGGPEDAVCDWLAATGGGLTRDFNQKSLRQWLRRNAGHRRFTVLRHPLARAHHVFCQRILATGPQCFGRIRRVLINRHDLPLPENWPDPSYDAGAHRAAFGGFLEFIKANLAGQTNLRIDPHWASQSGLLQGMGDLCLPDVVLREEDLAEGLAQLAERVGVAAPEVVAAAPDGPVTLAEIYDADLEALARAAYPRDYLMLGFGDWR
ncbi:nodulation protein NodH [Marinovum sp.]|uniref:nodulation protein NodH n=1 Tax=Marinovum sp. TaxID=2024839 RepID=UPI002B272454|nr:nodulation protein NodH [Marinovum sp.]